MKETKTNEEYSADLPNIKLYALGEGNDEWFFGTVDQCDDCFGLRIDANESDLLSFAKSQNAVVTIYFNGKQIERLEPADLVYLS